MIDPHTCKTAREAAYAAVFLSMQEKAFAQEVLERWSAKNTPSSTERALARQIAYGTIQRALGLDDLAKQLTAKGRLKLKGKERAIMRMGLYQLHYLDGIPTHAAVDETVKLAKKYCHPRFVTFLNALLRAYEKVAPELPKGEEPQDLSTRYSYPLEFVSALIAQQGLTQAHKLLELGNTPAISMLRLKEGLEDFQGETGQVGRYHFLFNPSHGEILEHTQNRSGYVQNATPVQLMHSLADATPTPKRLLDLCAAPGGKTLLLHDFYSEAEIYANDVSKERLSRLKENLERFDVPAICSCGPGEEYASDELFDLIVLDVPCSNSGVLNKRPEARWRLVSEQLQNLRRLQLSLVQHAITLLKSGGHLWYLTCSLLAEENTQLVDAIIADSCLERTGTESFILPNHKGWDGGYGCLLRKQ